MYTNCRGCRCELNWAYDFVKQGYHVATSKERELFSKGHLSITIVDDKGNILLE